MLDANTRTGQSYRQSSLVQPFQIFEQFAGSESDPSRSTTSACTGEGKTTPDGCKMSARRPSVVDYISLLAHPHQPHAPIRPAAVSGRATSVGHATGGEGDSNGGQPGQPDAHSPDAGGNRADQGAPGLRVEAPRKSFTITHHKGSVSPVAVKVRDRGMASGLSRDEWPDGTGGGSQELDGGSPVVAVKRSAAFNSVMLEGEIPKAAALIESRTENRLDPASFWRAA